jgi:hypothetical protein
VGSWCFERRRGHLLLRGHPGVPPDPGVHAVPAGPGPRTRLGEAVGGEVAGIRDRVVQRGNRPARVTGRDIMTRLASRSWTFDELNTLTCGYAS